MLEPANPNDPIEPGITYTEWLIMRGPFNGDILRAAASQIMNISNRLPWVHVAKVAWYAPGDDTDRLGLPIPDEATIGRWRPWVIKVEWSKPVSQRAASGETLGFLPAIGAVGPVIVAVLLAVAGLLVVAHFTSRGVTQTARELFNPGLVVAAVVIAALFWRR